MHKQRLALIIGSIVGMASVFLKWFQGYVILPQSLLDSSEGLENYPNTGYLIGIHSPVGGWFIFSAFLLVFLIAAFWGKRKELLLSSPIIILGVGNLFFTAFQWWENTKPDFYDTLVNQLDTAASVSDTQMVQGWSDLALVPPTISIGLILALTASIWILLALILFRKS